MVLRRLHLYPNLFILLGLTSFAPPPLLTGAEKKEVFPPRMEKLVGGENVLWKDPGDVSSLDFRYGVGGEEVQPQPPFFFIKEDLTGSNPKIVVKDAKDRKWSVKWSDESHSDVFASRIAWACGYITQPEYYIASGQIRGVAHSLKRAGAVIQGDGYFKSARFELRSGNPRFLTGTGWSWVNSPFRGSPQLNGLKIVMMLVSDWDNKDARDQSRDSNLAIFQTEGNGQPRYLYFVADWGGSMGKWGGVAGRSKWDAKGFADQTPNFTKRSGTGPIEWGYAGQRTQDQTADIRVSDVQWIMKYMGRITDDQIRAGLIASGATPREVELFSTALRSRIAQLERVSQIVPPGVFVP